MESEESSPLPLDASSGSEIALVPVRQQMVDFCQYLGLVWSGQFERIKRDPY